MATARPIEILLVEDNDADYEITKDAFAQEYSTNLVRVCDGESAIQYLNKKSEFSQATTPDVVLLDINLPGMSGLDVLREIRRTPSLKRTAVVMLTVSDDRDDIATAYDLNANCFITKPVEMAEFGKAMAAFRGFWLRFAQPPIEVNESTAGGNAVS